MSRILKFTLHAHGIEPLALPADAIIRHVGDQSGALQLWVETSGAEMRTRQVGVFYTGFDEIPVMTYVGTALSAGGSIVRHVYIED